MTGKKTVLIILDGWGHGDRSKSDSIYHANTPFINSLYKTHPNSELKTYGEYVGLPKDQMGNSEVGHLNIGAGRIVHQNLARINIDCKNNSIAAKKNLQKTFAYAKDTNKNLHLIGLVSDGGIHSHQNHLFKLCELAHYEGINNVFVHAFTDGRDCDPKSGKGFIKELKKNLFGAKIASVCGRYYAMDRDNRWDRIKLSYDLLTKGIGEKSKNLSESIQNSYNNGKPIVSVDENNNPIATINEGDAVICFNFRTDRCREITTVLTQTNMFDFGMRTLNLHYTTMTNYDDTYKNVNVIYNKKIIKNTLGEVLARKNKKQIRIAETEKYPHVTFFFSGGREEEKEIADFVCLNFANPDMVGHTGNYEAIKKAVETVDQCTQRVIEAGIKKDYAFIIIADHGNADFSINPDGTPNTAHSKNLVPCFAINTGKDTIENGKLGDIAPTILNIMGIEIPKEMTGNILTK